MPNARNLIYWDAPVWLSYINGVADRLPILDALLADSASPNGGIELITSAVSIVEVAFAESERTKGVLDQNVETQIDKLWADRATLKLVEFHEAVAREARQLMRMAVTKGWSLKPMDAIHLATARWRQVT